MALPDAVPILRLGTRGGALALWQAGEVARLIAASHPHISVESCVIHTTGDRATAAPLAEIEGTGLFTREIEEALLEGAIDIAVHSLKDLPTSLPDGLTLAAVLERADPRDALVAMPGTRLGGLPPGSRIGTSSLRRRAQLLAYCPQVVVLDVRGNVPTRLAKFDRGEYDALVLARAGLQRLGLDARVAEVIEPQIVVPAAGQGALVVEARSGDGRVTSLLGAIDHRPTRLATGAERAFLARLESGCQAPVGALGTWAGDAMTLTGIVASLRGERTVRGSSQAVIRTESEAEASGVLLAERLLQQGAADILAEIRSLARGDRAIGRDRP
ncbi:MAG: hydroxymethylbilane synthase [Acidobacteria bacterium]|nr:hydroxymethylbilane synthase [Acidobacteriota bacterium]